MFLSKNDSLFRRHSSQIISVICCKAIEKENIVAIPITIKILDMLLASINVIDFSSHLIDLLGFHMKNCYFDYNENI